LEEIVVARPERVPSRKIVALTAILALWITHASAALAPEHDPEVALHVDMRVTALRAGAQAAEVERVLGQPTAASVIEESGGDHRVLLYGAEPVRTRITITDARVTSIALDLVSIDKAALPPQARLVRPMMLRNGVLTLLGKPEADNKSMSAAGIEIEQMRFSRASEHPFTVFLADGLVVDVRLGNEAPPDILRVVLPGPIPDASMGTDLRIGLSLEQTASLLGVAAWMPIQSKFKGQPVLYATYHERSGNRLVSVTFTGGMLTAFSIWPTGNTGDLGDTCCFGGDHASPS
jgi:hypothetical protein